MLIYSKQEQLNNNNHDPRGQVLSYYLANDSRRNSQLMTCRLCGYMTERHDDEDATRHLLMYHLGVNWELENCDCGEKHRWIIPDDYEDAGGLVLYPNGFNMNINQASKEKYQPKLHALDIECKRLKICSNHWKFRGYGDEDK